MRNIFSKNVASLAFSTCLIAGACSLFAASDTNIVIGFAGKEIFPIDQQISNLRYADLDGDGLNDLVVANNSRSKITILYNRTGKTNAEPSTRTVRREINELPPDARFRIESVASEKRITDLVVADLNGDGRPDFAYYGEPKELVVQYNQGSNVWSVPKHFPIEDAQVVPNALATGDLNGDGLTDLLLLGDSCLYLLAQKTDHSLAEPEKIPFSGALKSCHVVDLNGDGRQDLVLANWDSPNPLRVRWQNAGGRLGPEIYFTMPPIRSYCVEDLDLDGRAEIVTIAQNSGRAQLSRIVEKPAEAISGRFRKGQFQVLPLLKTSKASRGACWGDVNSDGLPDLLVAEPDSGQLAVYLQQKDGSLAAARMFPTFTGVSSIEVADWDGNGPAEIFLLSSDERQVGVTRYDEKGRVAFPTPVTIDGKPLAIAAGRLSDGQKPALVMIVERENQRMLVIRTADNQTRSQKLSESFKANPSSMTIHDADQDGLPDIVVLIPYEKIKILRQKPEHDFEELDLAAPGGAVEQPWAARADVDGDGKPELLLAQKNFVRAVVLKASDAAAKNWNFDVKDQINGADSNSRIAGATALSQSGGVPSLFLLDASRKALTLCERDASGVWQVVKNIPLPFSEFQELQSVALGDKQPNSVALLGPAAVAWLPLHGQTWELEAQDGYETPIRDGRLMDVVSGDLNGDRRADLVFLETIRNYIDIVICDKNGKLVPATRWQVFEERSFRGRTGGMPEPREAVIADFTGDKKSDLIIMVHDRLILYPQE